jgi:hypothetical protein
MVEHGCTSFRVCGWQLLVVRISRVQEVARPRADASFVRNSVTVDAAPKDRETKRCDAAPAGFLNGLSTDLRSARRKARRGSTRRQAFRVRSHHMSFTGCLGDGPRPAGLLIASQVARHAVRTRRVRGVEADAIVPEGDASGPSISKGITRNDAETSEVGSCFGKGSSSSRGAEGRQASQRGCLHRDQSTEADGGEQPHHSPRF